MNDVLSGIAIYYLSEKFILSIPMKLIYNYQENESEDIRERNISLCSPLFSTRLFFRGDEITHVLVDDLATRSQMR